MDFWKGFEIAVLLVAVMAVSCREPHPARGGVVLKLATGASGAGESLLVARGADTIIIRGAELVLREIQLQRLRVGECEEEEGERCEMVAGPPTRLALPIGVDTVSLAPAAVLGDTFGTLQFEIYQVMTGRDSTLLESHPELDGASVRVAGTYSRAGNRRDFVFTSDMNEVQELALAAPFVVATGATSMLLLDVNVASWFVSADGAVLIDPATAGPGGPNAAQVRDNVRMSFGVRALSSP